MEFKLHYTMPYYYCGDMKEDARKINSIIAEDEEGFDMTCVASGREFVFDGFCESEELGHVDKVCDELIFAVTDERGE